MPLFSVIIPTYNRKIQTTAAVRSVLDQTFTDYEIIVVDDGSSDDTSLLQEEFGNRIIYIRQENSGVSSARNRGIRAGTSKYIAFLDSDDLWLPDKLESHIRYMAGRPGIKIHQCNERWIRKGRRVNPMKKHRKLSGEIFIPSLELCLISPSAACMERGIFDTYGAFDEMLPACEDYDLWLRITSREQAGFIEKELAVRHAGHSGQLSGSFWGMDRFRVYSLVKLLRELDGLIKAEYIEAARQTAMKKCSILMIGSAKRGNDAFYKKLEDLMGGLRDGCYSSTDARALLQKDGP